MLILQKKTNLNGHIAAVHEGRKPFKCNTCDACFSYKQYLDGHIAAVHERKKLFKCNFCDANFAKKS